MNGPSVKGAHVSRLIVMKSLLSALSSHESRFFPLFRSSSGYGPLSPSLTLRRDASVTAARPLRVGQAVVLTGE
jgi:hypothetical protein